MSLLRSNLAVAAGTAMSRLTGVLRVAVLGIVLGQTALADAYDGANNSPNQVYELLLGGVLSASLVPVFTRHVEDDDDESTSAVITVVTVMLAVLTAVAVAAAPLIFRMVTWGLDASVDRARFREAGTVLSRMFLVQIFFYGLMALASAVLNARRRFFAAAWTPVLANVITIAALLRLRAGLNGKQPQLVDVVTNGEVKLWLGLGATVGIGAMALALLPSVGASGFRFRPRFDLQHPAVRKVLTLSAWSLGYAASNIVASNIVRNLADYGSGGPDAYSKAYTFFTLPHGLLAVSIATTFVPDLARSVKRRERQGFIDRMSLGIRVTGLLTVPAGFGLFVLRRPLIGGIFQYVNFSAEAALRTSRVLGGLALGLAGFSIYLFVLRGFQAHTDTRTPFVINLGENILNVVFAVLFVPRWGVLGLGAAFALAYLLSAWAALVILTYKVRGMRLGGIAQSLWLQLLASVVMAEAAYLAMGFIGSNEGPGGLVRSGVGVVVGAAVYLGALRLLGAPELAELRMQFTRRST